MKDNLKVNLIGLISGCVVGGIAGGVLALKNWKQEIDKAYKEGVEYAWNQKKQECDAAFECCEKRLQHLEEMQKTIKEADECIKSIQEKYDLPK